MVAVVDVAGGELLLEPPQDVMVIAADSSAASETENLINFMAMSLLVY
jgi:hypothetical protein